MEPTEGDSQTSVAPGVTSGDSSNNESTTSVSVSNAYTFPNGDIYIGSWREGLMDGNGELRYCDGDVYTGHFKNGKREGRGRNVYADGDEYTGLWANDKFEGRGVYKWADGDVYEGEIMI